MERVLLATMLGAACFAHVLPAQTGNAAVPATTLRTDASTSHLTDVPPLPKGKSTILGGTIRGVDRVRDQFELNIYGAKPMKILYDERTQVYRDGKKIPLRDLGPATHASVQTMLDGASVFAVSIHILSALPAGDFQGQVISFNPDTRVLTLASSASGEPFRVNLSPQTSIKRLGQSAFSSVQSGTGDLVPGSLVSVKFSGDNHGHGLAQEISVLAAPGATFVFAGTIADLDLHTGSLMLQDARSNQRYTIAFDPTRAPASHLRAGQHVRISADYNGKRYVATEISIEQ